jgi:hypothetical protein
MQVSSDNLFRSSLFQDLLKNSEVARQHLKAADGQVNDLVLSRRGQLSRGVSAFPNCQFT